MEALIIVVVFMMPFKILMFVPAVNLDWTLGAVKFVKLPFVPDIFVAIISGVVRRTSQFNTSISPPLTFILDRLRLVVVFMTPFNILMFVPATSVAVEDMVVPTIVIPVPAVKVGWTLLAVKLVKVAFVPDTLRTFIFPVQLILLQLKLVIVPRVALLLVELTLVIVPSAPLILVELKLVIPPVKHVRLFVSMPMARTVVMSASSEKMPCEFNPMVSMVSASKV